MSYARDKRHCCTTGLFRAQPSGLKMGDSRRQDVSSVRGYMWLFVCARRLAMSGAASEIDRAVAMAICAILMMSVTRARKVCFGGWLGLTLASTRNATSRDHEVTKKPLTFLLWVKAVRSTAEGAPRPARPSVPSHHDSFLVLYNS